MGDGDIVWTMHTHHRACVAVSCQPQGVLPISTFANDLGVVSVLPSLSPSLFPSLSP